LIIFSSRIGFIRFSLMLLLLERFNI